jgi:hypothetical protein
MLLSGFIGSAILKELINAGHLGLTQSEAGGRSGCHRRRRRGAELSDSVEVRR